LHSSARRAASVNPCRHYERNKHGEVLEKNHAFDSQDFQFAMRQLRKSPGFVVTAVLPSPWHWREHCGVQRGQCSVAAGLALSDANRYSVVSSAPTQGLPMFGSSTPDYRVWRSDNHSSQTWVPLQRQHQPVAGRPHSEVLVSESITANLFPTMGVQHVSVAYSPNAMSSGRTPGCDPQLRLWERSFGSDPNVVGRK